MGKFQRFDGKPSSDDTQPVHSTHPSHKRCKVEDCGEMNSGSDGLCCFHRALRQGGEAIQTWRNARNDWREPLFADFEERHQDDAWGSALHIARDIGSASTEEQREFLAFLKTQARRAVRRIPHD